MGGRRIEHGMKPLVDTVIFELVLVNNSKLYNLVNIVVVTCI